MPFGRAYGLCGGMIWRAKRLFERGEAISPRAVVPPTLSREYLALQFEQWRSLSLPPLGLGGEAWRYLGWMRAPLEGAGGLGERTARELERLSAELSEGVPVPIGLVRSRRGEGRLWHNHQVLAYAMAQHRPGVMRVRVYDPNYPLDDGVSLDVESHGDEATTLFVRRWVGGQRLPGWFVSSRVARRIPAQGSV